MATKDIQLAQMIWQIRRLFQRMSSESNELLSKYALSASQRAVLEFLDHQEPDTLVNLARAHDVSRQHIQQVIKELMQMNLVESIDNPQHKRSFLIQTTSQGRKVFAQIKNSETSLFKSISQQFTQEEIQSTLSTLKQFNDFLHSDDWEKLKRQHIRSR